MCKKFQSFITSELYRKQLPRFIVVGLTAVCVDFISYTLLLDTLNYAPAKAASFIAGTIVAYTLNKYWTFEKKEHKNIELVKFLVLYGSTLFANVSVNHISLLLFPQLVFLAFLFATGTSTVLNFIGQKWWVFAQTEHE